MAAGAPEAGFSFDRRALVAAGGAGVIAGADEVGRGCLAGPLVVAAVALDYGNPATRPRVNSPSRLLSGLRDSKRLTLSRREDLFGLILTVSLGVSWTAVSAQTIDDMGLHRANLRGLAACLERLNTPYEVALVDGFDLGRPDLRAESVVGGDAKSAAIAAASVVAKVVRDRLMRSLHPSYPEYGFESHVGYGTPLHRRAIREHGPCALHRRSFVGVEGVQLVLYEDSEPGVSEPGVSDPGISEAGSP